LIGIELEADLAELRMPNQKSQTNPLQFVYLTLIRAITERILMPGNSLQKNLKANFLGDPTVLLLRSIGCGDFTVLKVMAFALL
jgi:hypothetical protein